MTVLSVDIPVITTERLRLRAPEERDLPAMTAFLMSERARFVGGPMDEIGAYRSYCASLGNWLIRGFGFWLVADRETDAALGRVGFLYGPGWHEIEFGWQVFDGAEGRGIAYEAASAGLEHGAAHMGLDGVISYVAPNNHRSRKLVERLGCTFERDDTFMNVDCQIWRHPKRGAA